MPLLKSLPNGPFDGSAPPAKSAGHGPIDVAHATITAAHFEAPAVNRLKERAMLAGWDAAGEPGPNTPIVALPIGRALALMTIASLALWALMIGGISLIL